MDLRDNTYQIAKELAVFNAFADILGRHNTPEGVVQDTLDMLVTQMNADRGWIYLFDETYGELQLVAHRGFLPQFLQRVWRLKSGECFAGKVFGLGEALLVENAADDPRVLYRDPEIMRMAGVPISSRGRVIGVLGIGCGGGSCFGAVDIRLLSTIGGQLGVEIQNMKLITQLQEKMAQIELISEISGMINSSLSIGAIFKIMASEIKKLIDYDRASLLLFDDKKNKLIIFALDTEMKTVMTKGVKAPIEGTSAGWVIRNNRPWINYDLSRDINFHLDQKLLSEGIRSTVSMPLFQDKLLGVFNLDSMIASKYSEKDLKVLFPVTKHISIALENALLFEEISREKKEWVKTFDAITDMLWIEDDKQRVMRANESLLRSVGLSAVDLSGKTRKDIFRLIGAADDAPLKVIDPGFAEIRGAGGGIFYFWSYPLLNDDGNLYASVHYLREVTAQRRLEQQLVRTDKLASLGTLVAGIAHEINNPLGIIAGYSEALLERCGDPALAGSEAFQDFPEYLQTIHNEIFRCKDILATLLEFARPAAGIIRRIDINELIKEVILLVNHKAKRLRHRIDLDLVGDLPKIQAEPGKLRQLFMNIIINSMYFTPEGGRIVIRTSKSENASIYPPDDAIKVSISDTGCGINTTDLPKIFDPFFTTKPVGDGTGLGLSICHKIAEEHGGTIDVESSTGAGTVFTIKLPVRSGSF
ncbi:MAG: GAF domain-containing sensor histidine kinase [Nitrospirae bacterium]|nr:MAG: GAF domain-containing sensor histidine kinase [Nitrospirota bacterium]